MFQQKPNTGSLFKNNKKTKDSQPDYSGSCLVNGHEMKIGAWLKTTKKGEKFFSMSFQVPQRSPQANGYQQKPHGETYFDKEDESSVPF